MSAIAFSAKLTASGTPQPLNTPTVPNMPQMIVEGVTYPTGSVTMRGKLLLQAAPTNTGQKIYVGIKGLNKTTLAACGMVLDKSALGPIPVGEAGQQITLDEIYWDGDNTGDLLLVTLVG